MRIQYRNRRVVVDSSFGLYNQRIDWGPWQDARLSDDKLRAEVQVQSVDLGTQVRIVDDAGNAMPMTPPFTPAYYQRRQRPGGRPGGLTWCTTPQDNSQWIRRDDVKPA